jgi:hypothetical protein
MEGWKRELTVADGEISMPAYRHDGTTARNAPKGRRVNRGLSEVAELSLKAALKNAILAKQEASIILILQHSI